MTEFRDKVRIDDVTTKAETATALLVVIDDEDYWIPKSQIDDDSEVYQHEPGESGTLVISAWIARQKGIG